MNIILFIYFGLNFFISGCYFGYSSYEPCTKREKILTGARTFLLFFIALPVLFAWYCVYEPLKLLYKTFDVGFYFVYIFRKKKFNELYGGMPEDKLITYKNICKNHFYTNSIKHRSYRYGVKLIFKLNNYLSV